MFPSPSAARSACPARYCRGYLLGPDGSANLNGYSFCAWFEVYLDGGWWTADARNLDLRTGRILVARGADAADAPPAAGSDALRVTRLECFAEPVEGARYPATTRERNTHWRLLNARTGLLKEPRCPPGVCAGACLGFQQPPREHAEGNVGETMGSIHHLLCPDEAAVLACLRDLLRFHDRFDNQLLASAGTRHSGEMRLVGQPHRVARSLSGAHPR